MRRVVERLNIVVHGDRLRKTERWRLFTGKNGGEISSSIDIPEPNKRVQESITLKTL